MFQEEPIYTMQDQVYHPTADPTYDIAPVASSHPHSSSLGGYGNMSMYGTGMSNYESLIGPPVPPPTPGLKETYGAISDDDEFFSDDCE